MKWTSDPMLMEGTKTGLFSDELHWSNSKPTILIVASCHGRTLLDYLNSQSAFRSQYNILRLETGPIALLENAGIKPLENNMVRSMFQRADILWTYNMSARHGSYALEQQRKLIRPDCKVVTWSAPNFSAFWPVAHNYCGALGVIHALQKGQSKQQIVADFRNGQFDSLFGLRWLIEQGRLRYRDASHDVKLAEFISNHHRNHKLMMGASHPSYLTCAYLGSRLIASLGHAHQSIEEVLSLDYTIGIMGGYPETDYEFRHYKFTYPKRHLKELGGSEFYVGLINDCVSDCSIPPD